MKGTFDLLRSWEWSKRRPEYLSKNAKYNPLPLHHEVPVLCVLFWPFAFLAQSTTLLSLLQISVVYYIVARLSVNRHDLPPIFNVAQKIY